MMFSGGSGGGFDAASFLSVIPTHPLTHIHIFHNLMDGTLRITSARSYILYGLTFSTPTSDPWRHFPQLHLLFKNMKAVIHTTFTGPVKRLGLVLLDREKIHPERWHSKQKLDLLSKLTGLSVQPRHGPADASHNQPIGSAW